MATAQATQLPTEWNTKNVRACVGCKLVKTFDQFVNFGCENCAFMDMEQQPERVLEATTTSFSGMCSSMDPEASWVARWVGVSGMAPGVYAMSVATPAEMTEEFTELLEQNGVELRAS